MSIKIIEQEKPEIVNESSKPIKKPLVFISHDTRDAELAEHFSKLLSSVSAGVLKSFRSSDKTGSQGIEYGVEWYPEIMQKLNEASDVVCLLTKNSVERPWILFEAGVAKGKLNTPLLGVAIGIPLKNANSGPFAQFQNCADDEDSLSKLVMQLARKIPNAEPDIDVIKNQVNVFLDSVRSLDKNSKDTQENNSLSSDTSVAKLFEEIKVMYSELPAMINRKNTNVTFEERQFKKRKYSMMMIEDLMHYSSRSKWGLLMVLSLIKDDFPWIYDVGSHLLNIIHSGQAESSEVKENIQEFKELLEFTFRGPIKEIFRYSNKDNMFNNSDFMHMLMDSIERLTYEVS